MNVAEVPFPVDVPARMQAGLSPADGPLARVDSFFEPAQRAFAIAVRRARLPLTYPDTGLVPAITSAAQRLGLAGKIEPVDNAAQSALLLLALRRLVQDDIVIMRADGFGGLRANGLAVAMPSHWRPEDKLNKSLQQLHEPVADTEQLNRMWPALSRRLIGGTALRRHVWTLTTRGDYSRHPDDIAQDGPAQREPEPASRRGALAPRFAEPTESSSKRPAAPTTEQGERSPMQAATAPNTAAASDAPTPFDGLFFRVERQTLVPLPSASACLFLIRVYVAELPAVLALEPDRAERLCEALASMSQAVVAYKGLVEIRRRLLAQAG